eukprot:9779273-Alexandrium_andersonii.AAC.1
MEATSVRPSGYSRTSFLDTESTYSTGCALGSEAEGLGADWEDVGALGADSEDAGALGAYSANASM